jgi:hypothetical protein
MKSPHAQLHLPPLDAGYALTLVAIFERAIDAIWRAHGHGMAELQTLRAEAQRASQRRRPKRAATPDDRLF